MIWIKYYINWNLSEPGYYEDGQFGIRHENIAQIVKADTKVNKYLSYYISYNKKIQSKMTSSGK